MPHSLIHWNASSFIHSFAKAFMNLFIRSFFPPLVSCTHSSVHTHYTHICTSCKTYSRPRGLGRVAGPARVTHAPVWTAQGVSGSSVPRGPREERKVLRSWEIDSLILRGLSFQHGPPSSAWVGSRIRKGEELCALLRAGTWAAHPGKRDEMGHNPKATGLGAGLALGQTDPGSNHCPDA